jgi:hypothetical protein
MCTCLCRDLTQVDPRWKPYVGGVSWEDIEKKLNENSKASSKKGKKKRAGKSKAKDRRTKYDAEAGGLDPNAESVIAAYTGQ